MTNQTWFGPFPHLACVALGVLSFAGFFMPTDVTAGERALFLLIGAASSALGISGLMFSGQDYRTAWMSTVASSSWLVGVAFVLFAALIIWFVFAFFKGLGDNLSGQ